MTLTIKEGLNEMIELVISNIKMPAFLRNLVIKEMLKWVDDPNNETDMEYLFVEMSKILQQIKL